MNEPVAEPSGVSSGSASPRRATDGAGYLPPLLGVCGFGLGLLIILWDKGRGDASKRFTGSAAFLMWVSLIAGQTALWLALAAVLYRSLREFTFERKVVKKAALYVVVVAVGTVAAAYTGFGRPADAPLAHHAWKMGAINLLGAAVVLLAFIGIWLAQAALERLWRRVEGAAGGSYSPDVIKEFLRIRSHLERYLLAAGLFVGAATLATGGLRNATVAFNPETEFPREHVLLYGLVASGILALVYAPAHAQLVSVRARLRDALAPLPSVEPASWSDWNSQRKAVEDLLEIHSGVIGSFIGSVSILTPLITSLVAILLGAGN